MSLDWNHLSEIVRLYCADHPGVPPLSLEELEIHADAVMAMHPEAAEARNPLIVTLNNEYWRPLYASIPFPHRLLLLPQCLRNHGRCPAEVDELGILCRHCGQCPIDALQREAERLGYAVLIAEGATVVTALIQAGRIDAILGVSCMDVLKRSFPFMEAAAIPTQAIPLLKDGCINTAVNCEALHAALYLSVAPPRRLTDLDLLRNQVDTWFQPEALAALLGPPETETRTIAIRWLTHSGKRWRPLLFLSAHDACNDKPAPPDSPDLRRLAAAVEFFHKASLIHDDIEDNDEIRDGSPALHMQYGTPVAINIGDYLIGEGYRLITTVQTTPTCRAAMAAIAAAGHCDLCLGQGKELLWIRNPDLLSVAETLEIFRLKTAPAFLVALRLGALLAAQDDRYGEILRRYSAAIGIAYQIQDDLADFSANGHRGDFNAMRPSILLAIACESADAAGREQIATYLRRPDLRSARSAALMQQMEQLHVREEAHRLLAETLRTAVDSLKPLDNPRLKCQLRRMISRMFTVGPWVGSPAKEQKVFSHEPAHRHGDGAPARPSPVA